MGYHTEPGYDPENPPVFDRFCAWAMGGCPARLDQAGLVPIADPDEDGRVLWGHRGCAEREYGGQAPRLLELGAQLNKLDEAPSNQHWDDYDEL